MYIYTQVFLRTWYEVQAESNTVSKISEERQGNEMRTKDMEEKQHKKTINQDVKKTRKQCHQFKKILFKHG